MDQKRELTRKLNEEILVLDGATGTELQNNGMPAGVCPELWIAENPGVMAEIHQAYAAAGSDIVYTGSFGGSPFKLEQYGLAGRTEELNRSIAALARKALPDTVFVAGDIGPSGHFFRPFGEIPFEEAVAAYKRQVRGLLDGGADLFIIETQMDIQESRAALLAVKELCDAFTIVTMTFDEKGRSLNGTTPEAFTVVMESLGADAVGCNCSTGPAEMLPFIQRIKAAARGPVAAKPNAGMPRMEGGETVFPMGPEEFAGYAESFAAAGVNLMGGCCGTTPEHIRGLSAGLKRSAPQPPAEFDGFQLASATDVLQVGASAPIQVIGERINPTGKKKLQAELKEGRLSLVQKMARDQKAAGARLLDVNAGMPGIDETETLCRIVEALAPMTDLPLVIDSADPVVVEAALRLYPGRCLLNSISGEAEKRKALLPLAARYGAMILLLPLADNELPETAERRIEILQDLYREAASLGFRPRDIVVDGLVMTVSSHPAAAAETLKTLRWAAEQGFGTVLGLSNISFGLPEREWINAAFLAMAAASGLSFVIANPSHQRLMNMKRAADVLVSRDRDAAAYVEHFGGGESRASAPVPQDRPEEESPRDLVGKAILEGAREDVLTPLDRCLQEGETPSALLEEVMIPAIVRVGDLYESQDYFLPQLIASAETMQQAFGVLEPILAASGESKSLGTLVFATVAGDIHDIGKNIVILMLRNYGFRVIDLGKDVASADIVAAAAEHRADIIALSALMTTTMIRMPEVIELARQRGLSCPVMVGGAVVTAAWAEEIGAHYSEDGVEAVRVARRLVGAEK